MKLAADLALPFLLALGLATFFRFALGPERGPKFAGIAIVGAFLVTWATILRPGWLPAEPLARIGHIALGAALAGLVLDVFAKPRLLSFAAAAVVIVSAWASVTGVLWPSAVEARLALLIAALAVVGWLVIMRLSQLRSLGSGVFVILVMVALALAAVSGIARDMATTATGVFLALAVLGFAVAEVVLKLPIGQSVVLGVGATLLALAWAIAVREPSARFALLIVPLILFADGTARRVPLPAARVSAVLFPFLLAGVAALPLLLAVCVAYVTYP